MAVTHPRKLCRFNSCPTHCGRARMAEGAGCDPANVGSIPTVHPSPKKGSGVFSAKHPPGRSGKTLLTPFWELIWLVRLSVQDTSFSHWKEGFNSPTSYYIKNQQSTKWWNRQTHGPQKAAPSQA